MAISRDEPPESPRAHRLLARHPLTAFFLLAYGVTWGGITLLVATGAIAAASIDANAIALLAAPMLLGPSLAGVALSTGTQGLAGLRALGSAMTRWRVPGRWFAVALLPMPLLVVAILASLYLVVAPGYAPGFNAVGLLIGVTAGALEEIGWTGFATPGLLRRFWGPRRGSVARSRVGHVASGRGLHRQLCRDG